MLLSTFTCFEEGQTSGFVHPLEGTLVVTSYDYNTLLSAAGHWTGLCHWLKKTINDFAFILKRDVPVASPKLNIRDVKVTHGVSLMEVMNVCKTNQ